MDDVLCANCGHEVDDHPEDVCWVEKCECKKCVPLATFQQLKEAFRYTQEQAKLGDVEAQMIIGGLK